MTLPWTKPARERVSKIDDEVAVGEDLRFQQAWWRFERSVWIFFVLLLALDLAGVFGRGPVANAEARSADGAVDLRYERIERSGTPSVMTVSLAANAVQSPDTAELFVSESIVGALGARRIIPQPAATRVTANGLTYRFPIGGAPARVRIELEPSTPGVFAFELGVPGRPPLRARVLVVP